MSSTVAAHPSTSDRACLSGGGSASLAPKARFLPAPLIRARAAALDPRNCQDLSRTARLALHGILAFFNHRKPAEPVFASRQTLCAEAMLGSQATLYRGLAVLDAKGYITREQGRRQAQAVYGQYAISRIWLTRKAFAQLGLPAPVEHSTMPDSPAVPLPEDLLWEHLPACRLEEACRDLPEEMVLEEGGLIALPATYPQEPSLRVRDRLHESKRTPGLQLSTKGQPLNASGQSEPKRAGESSDFDMDPKTRIPAELMSLIALGVSRGRVCWLMKLARLSGNGGKLGVVVKLVWERIKTLRAGAVFAYLTSLVRQKKDFSRMLLIQNQPDDPSRLGGQERQRLSAKLADLLARAHGMLVVSRAGQVLGTLRRASDATGYVEGYDARGVRRAMPANLRLARAWEEGEVTLRPV